MSYQRTADDIAMLINDRLRELKKFPSLDACQKLEVAGEAMRLLEYLKKELYKFESKAQEAERKKHVGSAHTQGDYMQRQPVLIVNAEVQHYQGID